MLDMETVRPATRPPQNYSYLAERRKNLEATMKAEIRPMTNSDMHKPKKSDSYFGYIIWKRRLELGLSQADVAKYLGIGTSEYIGLVERGVRRLELNKIPMIADCLQLNRGDLIRVALFELGPILALSLFGTDVNTYRVRANVQEPDKTEKTIPEAQQLQEILFSLPETHRNVVIGMIHSFAEANKMQLFAQKADRPRLEQAEAQ